MSPKCAPPRIVVSAPPRIPPAVVAAIRVLLEPEVTVELDRAPQERAADADEVVDARSKIAAGPWTPGTVAIVPYGVRTRLLSHTAGWTDRRRRVAVVSTSGLDLSAQDDRDRLAKVVAHEAGHVLGLRHCRRAGCLAAYAGDPSALEALTAFCPRCRLRLSRSRTVGGPSAARRGT